MAAEAVEREAAAATRIEERIVVVEFSSERVLYERTTVKEDE
jgi:hypothetical protein